MCYLQMTKIANGHRGAGGQAAARIVVAEERHETEKSKNTRRGMGRNVTILMDSNRQRATVNHAQV